MVKTLLFLLSLAMLFIRESTLNWEGTGNMSVENMTVIKNYIQANFSLAWTVDQLVYSSNFHLTYFSQAFSKELNRRWDQAWNVFAIYYLDQNNYDAVMYGYAFRDHWHWYNGLKFSDGFYASIVLWKDYNCQKWWSYSQIRDPSISYDIIDPDGLYSSYVRPSLDAAHELNSQTTNAWQAAYTIGQQLQLDSHFAFTIVASLYASLQINGYFCAKDYTISSNLGGEQGSQWGKAFIIQTR